MDNKVRKEEVFMKEISIYSKLTDEELEIKHSRLTDMFGETIKEALKDDSLSIDEKRKTLYEAIKTNESKLKQEFYSVNEFVKEYLYRELKELALIIYLAMEKNNDYGPMGEQRVFISFCRNILSIPNNREVTQFDADRLRLIIYNYDKKNENKSADEYINKIKNYSIKILGERFLPDNYYKLNTLLSLLKTDYYLYNYNSRLYTISFIFGVWKKNRINNNEYHVMEKEYIRSPQEVLSVAASIYKDSMFCRKESVEVVFFNKYQKYYDRSKAEQKRALYHINSAVRESIKGKALAFYDSFNKKDILEIKETFIEEMCDGIFWHEQGHHISYNDMDPIYKAFKTNFCGTGDVGHVLIEGLADWAPQKDHKQGAFSRFLELSKTDINRATRCLYVYMSDNWFLDEDEEDYMVLMSYVLVGLTVYFIKNDDSIDFDRLTVEKDQIYEVFLKCYNILTEKLISTTRVSKYNLGREILDYNVLEKKLLKKFKNSHKITTLKKLRESSSFWLDIFIHLRDYSKDGWEQYQSVLKEEAFQLEQMILRFVSKGNNERYNHSLKEYVIEHFKEVGILETPPKIDYKSIIQKICGKIKIPKKIQEKVQKRFKEIIDGINYNILIDYDCEKDPFIIVLQEIMLESGYGEINSGMFIGEYYDLYYSNVKRKKYIKDELETLRNQLESQMYLEIDNLKINKKYYIQRIVEKLLKEITFCNGLKLSEKIKSIECVNFNHDALMEVFIPLRRGYMDWNTSQAVWRINQDIRPNEYILEWTVDRYFLEALFEAYY